MKAILVATDLSERSDRAVKRAIRIARDHGAQCHVLHVVDDAIPGDMADKQRADAEARLGRFLAHEDAGDFAKPSVVVGDPLNEIPAEARTVGADLVVLGLHRRRPILDALRETTMERLVRLLDAPVLIVRDPADHAYGTILAPVSFSTACATALKAARGLSPEAKIAAFHAIHLPFSGLTGEQPGGPMDRALTEEAEIMRAKWCDTQGLPEDLCQVTPVSGSFYEMVSSQVEAMKPDLIAIGAHTRSGIALHSLGGFTASLMRNPPTDLLVARPIAGT